LEKDTDGDGIYDKDDKKSSSCWFKQRSDNDGGETTKRSA
jgi:hypothetical protein